MGTFTTWAAEATGFRNAISGLPATALRVAYSDKVVEFASAKEKFAHLEYLEYREAQEASTIVSRAYAKNGGRAR